MLLGGLPLRGGGLSSVFPVPTGITGPNRESVAIATVRKDSPGPNKARGTIQ